MTAQAGAGDFHCLLWLANMVQPCWFNLKFFSESTPACFYCFYGRTMIEPFLPVCPSPLRTALR